MFRSGLLAIGVLFCFLVSARADDVVGKVTAVDPLARTLSVKVDANETKYELTPDCKVYLKTGAGKRVAYNEVKDGLKKLRVGSTVTLSTDFQDGKDVATRIKVEALPGPPKRQ